MPLGKRTRRKKCSSSVPPNLESPRKRKKWSNESMINAMEAVKKGSSIKRAAEEYAVLRTTLQDLDKISDDWFRRFLECQPQLTLQKGDHTVAVRMDATKNRTDLDNYFKELKGILDENKLEDKPLQIYNMDESGIPLDHHSPCVLARKGQKKSTGNKSQITIVGCINVTGFEKSHLPRTIINL